MARNFYLFTSKTRIFKLQKPVLNAIKSFSLMTSVKNGNPDLHLHTQFLDFDRVIKFACYSPRPQSVKTIEQSSVCIIFYSSSFLDS